MIILMLPLLVELLIRLVWYLTPFAIYVLGGS